jgi:transcriptional regulator with XRE-family HTH domain
MAHAYSAKLNLVLKALSMSRGRLATELGVDKSIVGRWARGAVKPSPENLARLTGLIAGRITGFTILDWDRELAGLAEVLGVDPGIAASVEPARTGSTFHDELIDEAIQATARRAAAVEGFFRSTRPRGSAPGQFLHDHVMLRLGPDGLIRFDLRCDHVQVTGWVLPQRGQWFMIGAESVSGSPAFGIFNGVIAERVRMDVIDGLLLSCALDASLTPTACALVFERIGDLSGDSAADDARLNELGALDPVATPDTAPEALTSFLVRDIGPSQLAQGGDWLLRMPLARSIARGAGLAQRAGGFARAFSSPVDAP